MNKVFILLVHRDASVEVFGAYTTKAQALAASALLAEEISIVESPVNQAPTYIWG